MLLSTVLEHAPHTGRYELRVVENSASRPRGILGCPPRGASWAVPRRGRPTSRASSPRPSTLFIVTIASASISISLLSFTSITLIITTITIVMIIFRRHLNTGLRVEVSTNNDDDRPDYRRGKWKDKWSSSAWKQ